MSRYGWIVTDCPVEPSQQGITGPHDNTFSREQMVLRGQQWKVFDDDREFYAEGFIAGDYNGFEPLDDWAGPSLGAVTIKYKNPDGEWESL